MKSVYRQIGHDTQTSVYILEEQDSIPVCGPGEVLVQVKACALSPVHAQVLQQAVPAEARLRLPGGTEVAGIITDVGSGVTSLKHGDRIAGLLALDATCSGCAEFCKFPEYDLVVIPDSLSFTAAAVAVGDGLKAYTALHYLAHVCAGDTVLITRGASRWGWMALQLAQHWGAKIITSAASADEKGKLEKLQPAVAQIVEESSTPGHLVSAVMEETGGVGVDVVVDAADHMGSLIEGGPAFDSWTAYKHELMTCLSVGGKWVMAQPDTQFDPPDCQQLFLRGATVAFLFPHSWTLATSQQGRYQHILHEVVRQVATGALKPDMIRLSSFQEAVDTLNNWPPRGLGTPVLTL